MHSCCVLALVQVQTWTARWKELHHVRGKALEIHKLHSDGPEAGVPISRPFYLRGKRRGLNIDDPSIYAIIHLERKRGCCVSCSEWGVIFHRGSALIFQVIYFLSSSGWSEAALSFLVGKWVKCFPTSSTFLRFKWSEVSRSISMIL